MVSGQSCEYDTYQYSVDLFSAALLYTHNSKPCDFCYRMVFMYKVEVFYIIYIWHSVLGRLLWKCNGLQIKM